MNVLEELKNRGLIATDGHFVYKSGNHGTDSVDKEGLYRDIRLLSDLAHMIATEFRDDKVEVVTGPEKSILANFVGIHLHHATGLPIGIIEMLKGPGKGYTLSRSDRAFVPGKRVLVIDDIVDTGDTVKRVVHATRDFKGKVVGVGAIFNRGSSSPRDVGNVTKYKALAQLGLTTWTSEVCKHQGPCKRGIPLQLTVGGNKSVFPTGK